MHPEIRKALEITAKFLEEILHSKIDDLSRRMRVTEDRAAKVAYASELGAINHVLAPLTKRHSTSPILTDLRLSNLLTALTIVDRSDGPHRGPTLTEYMRPTSRRLPRTRNAADIDAVQLRNPPSKPHRSRHTYWIDRSTNTWYRAIELREVVKARLGTQWSKPPTRSGHHRLPGNVRRAGRVPTPRPNHSPTHNNDRPTVDFRGINAPAENVPMLSPSPPPRAVQFGDPGSALAEHAARRVHPATRSYLAALDMTAPYHRPTEHSATCPKNPANNKPDDRQTTQLSPSELEEIPLPSDPPPLATQVTQPDAGAVEIMLPSIFHNGMTIKLSVRVTPEHSNITISDMRGIAMDVLTNGTESLTGHR